MLAAMACALTPPGRRTVIDDSSAAIAAFLRPRPVRELPGIGAKVSATLAEYGLHMVGGVGDVPQLTRQRLLCARARPRPPRACPRPGHHGRRPHPRTGEHQR